LQKIKHLLLDSSIELIVDHRNKDGHEDVLEHYEEDYTVGNHIDRRLISDSIGTGDIVT
jgi:hypothetical protein